MKNRKNLFNIRTEKMFPSGDIIFVIILCLFFGICFPVDSYSGNKNNESICSILFIGNSITGFNSMPKMVETLSASAGKTVYVDAVLRYGVSIVEICKYESTIQKLYEKAWDYVVIQGDIHNTAFPETHHIIMPWVPYESIPELLREMKEKIIQINASTKILFFMPWAYEDGMTWIPGQTDTYETMQVKIKDSAVMFGQDCQIMVAPVGWAWYQVYNDRGVADLFMSDFVHATLKGSYLAACVFYSTIFLESCEGISYYAGLSQTDAEYFQFVASSVVLDNLKLWNLTLTNSESINGEIPADFKLYQNYPNPFNPSTEIDFSVPDNNLVNLTVYNSLGQELVVLMNKQLTAGKYKAEFNGTGLSSGIYFYQLKAAGLIRTKKMVLVK